MRDCCSRCPRWQYYCDVQQIMDCGFDAGWPGFLSFRCCQEAKGLRYRISPICTLSQNGYGDCSLKLAQRPVKVDRQGDCRHTVRDSAWPRFSCQGFRASGIQVRAAQRALPRLGGSRAAELRIAVGTPGGPQRASVIHSLVVQSRHLGCGTADRDKRARRQAGRRRVRRRGPRRCRRGTQLVACRSGEPTQGGTHDATSRPATLAAGCTPRRGPGAAVEQTMPTSSRHHSASARGQAR